VLSLPPSVRLFVATQPVDGRKDPDSLMALVRDVIRHDPLSGHLFIFFSKRCDRVRIVYWDRNGYAMWTERLEKGRFRPTTFLKDGRRRRSRSRPPSWRWWSRASSWRGLAAAHVGSPPHCPHRNRRRAGINVPSAPFTAAQDELPIPNAARPLPA
jgi:transposase